jgi:hypothetical protein
MPIEQVKLEPFMGMSLEEETCSREEQSLKAAIDRAAIYFRPRPRTVVSAQDQSAVDMEFIRDGTPFVGFGPDTMLDTMDFEGDFRRSIAPTPFTPGRRYFTPLD